jgi:glycosyltransferase involved in cell wall biosynthesis
LRDEGIDVELMMFDRVPSRDYIYIQAQADIVVEELIRGCWGSTAVECLALGKPVLTFIRPEWETMYLKTFPSIKALPIVNTNKHNIYDNLKTVILNDGFRRELQLNSRKFAEEHFDVLKNTSEFERLLTNLQNSHS